MFSYLWDRIRSEPFRTRSRILPRRPAGLSESRSRQRRSFSTIGPVNPVLNYFSFGLFVRLGRCDTANCGGRRCDERSKQFNGSLRLRFPVRPPVRLSDAGMDEPVHSRPGVRRTTVTEIERDRSLPFARLDPTRTLFGIAKRLSGLVSPVTSLRSAPLGQVFLHFSRSCCRGSLPFISVSLTFSYMFRFPAGPRIFFQAVVTPESNYASADDSICSDYLGRFRSH